MHHSVSLGVRSLRARPLRTVLTLFGVVLGVAVVFAINVTNLSTLDAISLVFNQASGKAHLVVASANTSGEGFSEDRLRRIATVPGLKAAVPVLQAQAMLPDDAATSEVGISMLGAAFGGLTIYGIDPSLDLAARDYSIVAGDFLPSDLSAYDIILVKDYADEQNIRLGNDIQVETPAGTAILRVVGLMAKEGPGQLNNGAFGAVPLRAAQEIFGRAGRLDQVDIVAEARWNSGAELEKLKAALQERLGPGYTVTFPAARGQRVAQMFDGYQTGLNMFALIAAFVGAFLIYNTFSMTVIERTREIGTLRTLGMTRGQILGQILIEAVILALAGSALGLAAGWFLAQGLTRGMAVMLGQEVSQIRMSTQSLLTGTLVGVMVTLVAALSPAWQGSRISPLEALRIRATAREGWLLRHGWQTGSALLAVSYLAAYRLSFPPFIEARVRETMILVLLLGGTLLVPATVGAWERAVRPLVGRLYGSEGQLGSRNIRRQKLRTTLTVAALMVGVAMILSIRSITGAFSEDIRSWIEKYIGGDLYVHSSLAMRADLAQRLQSVEGVAAVTPIRYVDVERVTPEGTHEPLSFMAIDPASYGQVTALVFAAGQGDPAALLDRLGQGGAVFVSTVLAEKHGLAPGDVLRLETRRSQRDFEVAGIVVDFYNQGLVVQGSWSDLRRYFGINDVTAFLIKLQPGLASEPVRETIDRLYGRSMHVNVASNDSIKGQALALIARAGSLFDVLALISMIVAALGVVNTLTMNVLERTQEIGMLRSLGMTRGQVGKMILAEAGMMGLVGGIFGLAFGLYMSHTVLNSINRSAGYDLAYVMPTQGIFVSLVIALVVSQLAALWPARRAARLRIIEAVQIER